MRPRAGWRTNPGSGMAPQWLRALVVAGAAALGWMVFAAVAAWAWIALTAPAAHAASARSLDSAVAVHVAFAGHDDTASQSRRAEYGVALAMSGQYHEAESAFASLLSASPRDARALANLGNLRVVRGELKVAIAFYDQALRYGANEAGIVLNRATALMLMGEQEQAEAEAARGIALAGGEAEAEQLLGLPSLPPNPAERAGKPFVGRQQIREMLRTASRRLPGMIRPSTATDSTRSDARTKRPTRTWRTAGSRAGDGDEIASVLYWKR
jgi:tetratricopeptide (TPR) repeat protein